MNEIKPGTACYLTALVDFPELTGRVVEVIAPVPAPEGESGQWFQIRATWTLEMFDDRDTVAPRCNLLPLPPPAIDPPEARKRTPEAVGP